MINDDQDLELKDIDGLTVKVTFELPFCLYLENGVYEVDRGGWAASVQLERVAQTNLDPRLGIAQSTGELVRDRYGRLRFSKVVIRLPGKAVIEIELRRQVAAGKLEARDGVVKATLTIDRVISDYGNVAFEEAINTVNRLIEVYRHVTDQFQIRRIPSEEIFKADIQWYQNDELLGGTWYLGSGHGLTLEPQAFDAQTMERLRSWLSSTSPVHVAIELFQDAKDLLDRAEYRLAVINARTALEVLVDEVLLGYFSASSISLEAACRVLDVGRRKVQTLEDSLQRSLINHKVGFALKQALNLDLYNGNPVLWQRWLRAKKLRERGVHRGEEVDRAEAVEAVNTMGEIIDDIMQALRSTPWLQNHPEINQRDSTPAVP